MIDLISVNFGFSFHNRVFGVCLVRIRVFICLRVGCGDVVVYVAGICSVVKCGVAFVIGVVWFCVVIV